MTATPTSSCDEKVTWRIFFDVGRIHIVIIAAMGVFTFGWLFTGHYPWLLTCVCALDWYIVNLFNKTTDLEEDKANQVAGTEFISRKKKQLIPILFAVLIISLILVHFLNPFITVLRITCHLLGLLYNWPLLPGARRLKALYFWKNTASAAAFLITMLGYPLAPALFSEQPPDFPMGISWPTVFYSALFLFLFVSSYEIIYDLRDIHGDKLAGLRTYPCVHGQKKAVRLIDVLMVASIAVLLTGYLSNYLPWRIFILAAAPVLQIFVYKNSLRRGISAKSCICMTWMGAAMFFTYHLWVIAGLPGACP